MTHREQGTASEHIGRHRLSSCPCCAVCNVKRYATYQVVVRGDQYAEHTTPAGMQTASHHHACNFVRFNAASATAFHIQHSRSSRCHANSKDDPRPAWAMPRPQLTSMRWHAKLLHGWSTEQCSQYSDAMIGQPTGRQMQEVYCTYPRRQPSCEGHRSARHAPLLQNCTRQQASALRFSDQWTNNEIVDGVQMLRYLLAACIGIHWTCIELALAIWQHAQHARGARGTTKIGASDATACPRGIAIDNGILPCIVIPWVHLPDTIASLHMIACTRPRAVALWCAHRRFGPTERVCGPGKICDQCVGDSICTTIKSKDDEVQLSLCI